MSGTLEHQCWQGVANVPLFANTSLTQHGNRDATGKLVLSNKNNLHLHLVPSRLQHAPAHPSPARPRANWPKPDCATLDHMHVRTLPSPAQRNQAAKPGKQREQQKGARAQDAARRSHTAAEHHQPHTLQQNTTRTAGRPDHKSQQPRGTREPLGGAGVGRLAPILAALFRNPVLTPGEERRKMPRWGFPPQILDRMRRGRGRGAYLHGYPCPLRST